MLIKELHELEQAHKKKVHSDLKHALVLKRDKLNELMEQETRQVFNRVAKERYQWGNKPGKYRARI